MNPTFQAWDEALLLCLHQAGQEPWDTLFYYATRSWVWTPLFIWWAYLLYRAYGRRFIQWVAFTLFAVTLTDFLCARALKPWVGRIRPSHTPHLLLHLHLVRGYDGGKYGFPSNHAANSAALATSLTLALRRKYAALTAILWAIFHSYTRLYLGVHYPSDILAGWGIGMALTLLLYFPLKSQGIL